MKKKILPIIAILFSTIAYAQLGINTTTPKSTLDITAKNATGSSTATDGLLIPRIDRQRAQSMISVEPSTLIYINDVSTGSAAGQTSIVDSIGFYYFDGTTSKWTKLNNSSIGDSTPDAFIDDPANNMVKLGATSTGLTRAVNSDFVVKDNGNVGIGTSDPSERLHVIGNGYVSEKLGVNATRDAGLAVKNTTPSEPIMRLADTDNINKVVVTNDGDVGIGTSNPTGKLEISSTNSGLVLPRLTNSQRDVIPVNRANVGTVIYNTSVNKIQVNIGTDANRVWTSLDTSSSTINTTIAFQTASMQTINNSSGNVPVRFENVIFNNMPAGFVTKQSNNTTVNLAAGKSYRIDVNMGRISTNTPDHTWCSINDLNNPSPLASVSILPNNQTSSNWNSFNTMQAYVTVENSETPGRNINIKCTKTSSGTVSIFDGIPATWTITIMN
jgi:hypothetical protein